LIVFKKKIQKKNIKIYDFQFKNTSIETAHCRYCEMFGITGISASSLPVLKALINSHPTMFGRFKLD
jgi:hypothetical protein